MSAAPSPTPYFRRDKADGITPPNLADQSTYAEHIVHARGKRTRFTSVSTDPATIVDFGPQLWCLLRPRVDLDGHVVVEHVALIAALRREISAGDPAAKERAHRAMPRAQRRKEGLVEWVFDVRSVARKDLLTWAAARTLPYFVKA